MAIPKTMKAAQIVAYSEAYQIREVPVPAELQPQDVLIKVAVASHCHTDFEVVKGHWQTPFPCTGSHEGSGTIVAVGRDVSGLTIGDRVMGGMLSRPCGNCFDCTGPETNRQYCTSMEGYPGVSCDGFFAEYVRCDARHTVKLPPQVSLIEASPFACAGRTVWRALQLTGLTEGQTVAIIGCGGGLGHLAVRIAKALKLKIIGVDNRDEALSLAKSCGVDVLLDARDDKTALVSAARAATGGFGADCTISLSFARESPALACAITKMHATVIQVAEPEVIEIPPDELVFRDIRIRSTLIASGDESREMIDFFAKHNIHVDTQLFYGIEKISELVNWAHQNRSVGKGCLVLDQGQLQL
ncbi:GroES-like protein [Thozetella sp. PMI_491]|nr:GroES-like protein [Thozetella sp. PMI_491]